MKSNTDFNINGAEITPEEALNWFQKSDFSDSPPYFLTHWKTKKSFFVFQGALLAFENTKGQFIITGEPATNQKTNEADLYKAFLDFAHQNEKKVSGYYVGDSWGNAFFSKRQMGTSFRIDLETFNVGSSEAKEVRRSLRKGNASEYKVLESSQIDFVKLKALMKKWKTKKLPIRLNFFLSEPETKSPISDFEKWFVIEKNNEYFAFCSLLPYTYNRRKGFYIDHLVHNPYSERFALSFLISVLILDFKKQGAKELNLGLNPFAKVPPETCTGKLFYYLYRMPVLYRPRGLHYFKSKFAGQEENEYFFYEKKQSPWVTLVSIMRTGFTR